MSKGCITREQQYLKLAEHYRLGLRAIAMAFLASDVRLRQIADEYLERGKKRMAKITKARN